MGTAAAFHMRCPRGADIDLMRRRFRLFSNDLGQRLEDKLREVRRSYSDAGLKYRTGEAWLYPDDLREHSGFMTVTDTDYVFAGVTPLDVDRLSRDLGTEVIFLLFSSSSEALQFTHSVSGTLMRHLCNGAEGWAEVFGTPEPWEAQAFPLEQLDGLDADLDDGVEMLRAAHRVPCVGLPDYFIDAREAARAVGEHYRLLDWID